MYRVALKMLLGDRVKYLGLVFGVAFATLLITQQSALFAGLMGRTSSLIHDTRAADIWVMDPQALYVDSVRAMRETELSRVRGVPGVAWAVPLSKTTAPLKTLEGRIDSAQLVGVDDATLIGAPQVAQLGTIEALRRPDAVVIDPAGFHHIWPGQPLAIGRELELNDRRAVIVGIAEAAAAFTAPVILYARYSVATEFIPQGRNRLSFILAKAAPGEDPAVVAQRIAAQTGLQALDAPAFAWKTVVYYLRNTGIPINFGLTIILGLIVGIAIVGLTFAMFVSDNIRQYAALKAMGTSGWTLSGMVLLQAAVVGGLGYAIGSGLAALFFTFATRGESALRGFIYPWWVAALVLGLIVVVMLLATFASLRRVLAIDPASVFRG